MAVLRCLAIDWIGKVEFLYNNTWSHVKILLNDLDEFIR